MSTAKPAKMLSRSVLGVAVVAAFALAGCGAGQVAQTDTMVAAVPGTSDTIVDSAKGINIGVRDVVVQYGDQAGYPKGGNAPLVVRIFNNGKDADKLIGVESDAAKSVTLVKGGDTGKPSTDATASSTPSGSASPDTSGSASESASPSAPANEPIALEIPIDGFQMLVPGEGDFLQLTDLTRELKPGAVVSVTFIFEKAGEMTMDIPMSLPAEPNDTVSLTVEESPEGE